MTKIKQHITEAIIGLLQKNLLFVSTFVVDTNLFQSITISKHLWAQENSFLLILNQYRNSLLQLSEWFNSYHTVFTVIGIFHDKKSFFNYFIADFPMAFSFFLHPTTLVPVLE